MVSRALRRGLGLAALCLLAGCGLNGAIYTHVHTPLDLNLDNTPVMDSSGRADVKKFEYYVTLEWDSNAIGEIAREKGFSKVHYADLETLSILRIWTQRWVHVYGE